MAEKKKETRLSIIVRTVDKATAKIKAINDRLDAATKPARDFRKALSDLREKSGLDGVVSGFKGVGSAITGVLSKIGMIGGVVAGAVVGLKSLIDGFDDLGDLSERVGMGVDSIAQLRWAAEKSGASVEQLDKGLESFSKGLGLARANTGGLHSFLKRVNPELLKQLKAAKGNEQAFNLLSDAMVNLTDPAKRAAAAQAVFGDASLAPLLHKGSKGIKELRDRYAELAGPQEGAAAAAGDFGDSMDELKATTDGVKAALVTGLAPALKIIVERLRDWLTAHRDDIAQWAKDIGERLPGAIQKVVEWVGKAWDRVTGFVDAIGGLKNAAIGLVGLALAPLITSVVSLGGSLLTVVLRVGSVAGAFTGASTGVAGFGSKVVGLLGPIGLAIAGLETLNQLTGGSIGAGEGGAMGIAEREIARRKLAKEGRTEFTDAVFRARDLGAHRSSVQSEARDVLQGLPGARGDVTAQARDALSGARSSQAESFADAMAARPSSSEANITIDIKGAPTGTRATIGPQSTAAVDLSVGYQMLPGLGAP